MAVPPYDTVTTVVNAARVRLNDFINTLQPIGGAILKNTQPFSQQVVNNAWRKMQEQLANFGYTGLDRDTLILGVPPTFVVDPASQVYINYAGYYNGATLSPTWVLPQDMITPFDLWERPNGSGLSMTEMDRILNGLPAVPKVSWNRQWEWRNDTLYMPGALVTTDIRLRYGGFVTDFVDSGSTPWYTLTVPIMRCLDSFADYMCREIMVARGDMEGAAAFQASGEANAGLVLNRDTAQPKKIFKAAEFGKMQDRFTPNTGADTQPIKR